MATYFGRLAERTMAAILAQRHRLPRFVNRLIDDVAKNPDGFAGKTAARLLGGGGSRRAAAPTTVPARDIRVYIGPTNYAGQGWQWARALEASDPSIGARNMAIDLPGGFAFPADSNVSVGVHTASVAWQRAELDAVSQFTHVMFEAGRALFGPLLGRDVARELAELERRGVSCSFMCHGTDIRSPRLHMERDALSPYFDDPHTALFQREADDNLALLKAHERPVFVSTPDLLADVPWAYWCPVVVDVDRWETTRELLSGTSPVVAHFPSVSHVKGTRLIEPIMHGMHRRGLVEYRSMTGIRSSEMPRHVAAVDIVLDQFRIGSYGVAAVEAMAAGRVVVGHVLPDVRDRVRQAVGLDLPIVEAVPDTLESVLTELLADESRMRSLSNAGQRFARQVHSGAQSAHVLKAEWIDRNQP